MSAQLKWSINPTTANICTNSSEYVTSLTAYAELTVPQDCGGLLKTDTGF